MRKRILAGLLLGATFLPALQGCVPVVVAGATAGALATIDRRSLGTQTEDETIEWKASARVGEKLGDKIHVNYTSYNRKVLMSGEVYSADQKPEAERIVSLVPNVAAVYNELVVGPTSSFTERSNDSFITSKVKSRSVDSGKYNPVHVKVVTEAGVVFLMGLVTQAEADSAINVARTTGGVKKVVNLFEIIEPAKARELDVTHSNNNSKAPEEKVQ
ncbi:BON domain-containing protein [Propionivibrio sp.]|uniref:BON domain-containing protein n=1 Tax=Propionivibrio sp. TaxID=2212460 RepID=UPI0025FF2EA7|nr:BON domain-containing protein [Propionivibrio sp.]MBK7355271.1 BON domain-containing protein [Propionivibrio sp.]MBK8399666.1 BON domain-containing protein [Propionivibrio sp.]MBK8744959.1 BON domain-containing protein [Propionivibrio sp.]MBK8893558.1 BON domain-containing protein [Propionivibrio sp.]MBL0208646.1 BON domain-containing protein [Propionivibrio sp.]